MLTKNKNMGNKITKKAAKELRKRFTYDNIQKRQSIELSVIGSDVFSRKDIEIIKDHLENLGSIIICFGNIAKEFYIISMDLNC